MTSPIMENNKYSLKSIISDKLINKEIKEICLLKDKHWKFGIKSQLKWFKRIYNIDRSLISDLEKALPLPVIKTFKLNEDNLNVLEVPPGFATSIKQYSNGDRICVYADYQLGVSGDEDLRWDL